MKFLNLLLLLCTVVALAVAEEAEEGKRAAKYASAVQTAPTIPLSPCQMAANAGAAQSSVNTQSYTQTATSAASQPNYSHSEETPATSSLQTQGISGTSGTSASYAAQIAVLNAAIAALNKAANNRPIISTQSGSGYAGSDYADFGFAGPLNQPTKPAAMSFSSYAPASQSFATSTGTFASQHSGFAGPVNQPIKPAALSFSSFAQHSGPTPLTHQLNSFPHYSSSWTSPTTMTFTAPAATASALNPIAPMENMPMAPATQIAGPAMPQNEAQSLIASPPCPGNYLFSCESRVLPAPCAQTQFSAQNLAQQQQQQNLQQY